MADPTSSPAQAAEFFDPESRQFTAEARPDRVPVPTLDGQLVIDDASLTAAGDDFGHLVHRRPSAVLLPGSAADVAVFSRFASDRAIPLVPRGQGHSTAGQAQTGGVVVDMSPLNEVHHINSDSVVVDAGARWSQVLAATIPHGLTPPVLTDYLELSVGGTLSVGGIGGASHHHGAQTDNVLALDVITPDGTTHACSPGSDLYSAVLAGRGRQGIIVGATLRLIPAPRRARTYRLHYAALGSFLTDQRQVMSQRRFDHLVGQAKLDPEGDWSYVINATTYSTPPSEPDTDILLTGLSGDLGEQVDRDYPAFLDQMADDVSTLQRLRLWSHSHPWLNLLIPDDSVEEFVATALGAITRQDLGDAGVVLLYPVPTSAFTTPRLRMPNSPTAFLFALLRAVAQDEHDTLRRMTDHNDALTRMVTRAGGTSYLSPL
ncbi:FAD-binding protein [Umezawaea tangerina]|uniref:FAD/FMN-containing dehydrogenase n=1 Tax=Umezawaea tangerina TaxID=84725 RepID=A0A2T0S6Z3_9PSEU|nr:FAD-binding protein [Umezawaea tangerina]PRY29197.1 FAD/FMN-containing dehydrogenase [Umezawaea tangerina]